MLGCKHVFLLKESQGILDATSKFDTSSMFSESTMLRLNSVHPQCFLKHYALRGILSEFSVKASVQLFFYWVGVSIFGNPSFDNCPMRKKSKP